MGEWKQDTSIELLDSMYNANTLTGYSDLRERIQKLEADSALLDDLIEMLVEQRYIRVDDSVALLAYWYEFKTIKNDNLYASTPREAIKTAVKQWKEKQ